METKVREIERDGLVWGGSNRSLNLILVLYYVYMALLLA